MGCGNSVPDSLVTYLPTPLPRPLFHSPCHCHFLPIEVKWLNSLMRANISFAYCWLKYILLLIRFDNVLQLDPNLLDVTMGSNIHNRLSLFPSTVSFPGLLLKLLWCNHFRLISYREFPFIVGPTTAERATSPLVVEQELRRTVRR